MTIHQEGGGYDAHDDDTYAAKRDRRMIDGRPIVAWWRFGMVDRRGRPAREVTDELAAREALNDKIEDDDAARQRS